jgi:hypothetical protein
MIAWTPADDTFWKTAGQVVVVPHPDFEDLSEGYRKTTGACFAAFHEASDDQRLAMILLDFHSMVVRDGIDPRAAHAALLVIDEYRRAISPDVEGADDAPEEL